MRILILSLLAILLLAPSDAFAQKKKRKRSASPPPAAADWKLDLQLENSSVFAKAFTGFSLYDPELGEVLYDYQADKYFTPASNVKILTLFTGLQLLGDSIPALRYLRQGELTILWGTGDPSFLNSHLAQNPRVFDFLKNESGQLLFCPANFRDLRYGSGWMWSDFPYAYQAEKSPFPIYGNVAHFYQNDTTQGIEVQPAILRSRLRQGHTLDPDDHIGRAELDNVFTFNDLAKGGGKFDNHVPFHCSPAFFAELLSDTLRRTVSVLEPGFLPPANAQVIFSLHADDLYLRMMQESDNFIAEQVLLLCSERRFGTMNTEQVIDYSLDYLLTDLPDKPRWVDGSGLSRYNLITPRSQVKLLEKIYKILPRQRLLNIFPAGGESGTIKGNYRNGNTPYVYAKTGTLRHNHCLSGYLVTKRGKVLIFSFMHNNYTGSMSTLKREMEVYLKQVYETM